MIRALVFVFAAACGAPAKWQPAAGFNTLVVDRDLVLRGDADGSVSAAVIVRLDNDSAVGTVRLIGTPITDAARSPHLALARARAWQVLSKQLEASPERAFEAVRRGVEEIRSCCHNDIGMYIHAAEQEFQDPARRTQVLVKAQGMLSDLVGEYVRHNHTRAL